MKTLIIDNYDSFTYNLYQILGELGANPEVIRNDAITIQKIKDKKYTHIVISPGPGDPSDQQYFGVCRDVILNANKDCPILGVCLGHQGIIHYLGGKIVRADKIFHGKKSKILHNGRGIFTDIRNPIMGMRYHSLVGQRDLIPHILEITAETEDGVVMGVAHKKKPIFGIQFHPESVGTEEGMKILKNFLGVSYEYNRFIN